MVRIASPPPRFSPEPNFHHLEVGSHIVRIFNPNRYNTLALTFRFYGPLHRFDHHRGKLPANDQDRGVYYAAFTLSGCLVEVFGDTGIIEIADERVCRVTVIRPLRLLDLRGSGAMKAGSVSALAKTADRSLSQEWSRYFYERDDLYSRLDGMLYFNAHNDEEAICLYERASGGLACDDADIIPLDSPLLRPAVQEAALTNHLVFVP
jgi:hypothetical protein